MKHVSRKVIAIGVTVAIAGLAVAAATAAVDHSATKKAGAQVCVLLPDTKSSVRWVQFDAPAFAKAFKKAGVTARSITR